MKLPKKWWARILLILAALFLLIQLVPYGRSHTNPPVGKGPAWDRPETLALAKRACFDCHSNETAWPWYSHVAPFSWLVQDHVDEARAHLNFSAFDKPQKHADDAAEELAEGEMPPWDYLLLHPDARLSDAETQALVTGLKASFGSGLIAIVGPNVRKDLFQSQQDQAKVQMSEIGKSISMYKLDHRGKVPDSLDELTQKDERMGEAYMEKIPNDPWDQPYDYRPEGRTDYRIISAGPDNAMDTDDDLTYPVVDDDR